MQKNLLWIIYTDMILDLWQLLLNCELCVISPFKGSLQTLGVCWPILISDFFKSLISVSASALGVEIYIYILLSLYGSTYILTRMLIRMLETIKIEDLLLADG